MVSAAGAADMAKPADSKNNDNAVVVKKRSTRDRLGGGVVCSDEVELEDSVSEVDAVVAVVD
jgi:hypothetical protein